MTWVRATNGPIPQRQDTTELGPAGDLTRDEQRAVAAVVVRHLGDTADARTVLAALVHPPYRTPSGHTKRTREQILKLNGVSEEACDGA